MLLFHTLLNISPDMSEEDFIHLVIEWNRTSQYEENRIKDLNWRGEKEIRWGENGLSMEIRMLDEPRISAVRYSKTEPDGIVWTTDYVMNFDELKMAIRLDRSYREEALTLNSKFSTPHFITLLIEKGWLRDDHGLPVSRRPLTIDENNVSLLGGVVRGNSCFDLPVVYVSRTYYDEDPVDLGRMASRLKGIAHVFAEKNIFMDKAVRAACDDQNEYYGAVGVYYPAGKTRNRRFLCHAEKGQDEALMEKVIRNVMEYSNSQLLDSLYTWHGVNNAILAKRIDAEAAEKKQAREAQKKAEDEVDQVYDLFDRDLEKLRRLNEELANENLALQAEIQGLRTRLSALNAKPALLAGEEEDFFHGETAEILLDALSEALKNSREDSRRAAVFKDILSHNEYPHTLEERKEDIKNLFTGYRTMSSAMRKDLEAMGFTISEDGRHYRLTYFNDPRFSTVIAKSGSDHREGKNIASLIGRQML